jgi:hypothetical protein
MKRNRTVAWILVPGLASLVAACGSDGGLPSPSNLGDAALDSGAGLEDAASGDVADAPTGQDQPADGPSPQVDGELPDAPAALDANAPVDAPSSGMAGAPSMGTSSG